MFIEYEALIMFIGIMLIIDFSNFPCFTTRVTLILVLNMKDQFRAAYATTKYPEIVLFSGLLATLDI